MWLHCQLDGAGRRPGASCTCRRAYRRVLKLARTIADLAARPASARRT